MLGSLDRGVLGVREVHRFVNEPVRQNGSLQWDILHLWQEMRRALDLNGTPLDSIGVDSWGVDYALIGERGDLLENPYHYRDGRTAGAMEAVFERVCRERIYAFTGIQFLPINTIYQLFAACRTTPKLIDAARALVTIPDLPELLADGRADGRVHGRDDHAVHRCADSDMGPAHAGGDRAADAAPAAARRTRHHHRLVAGQRVRGLRRDAGGGARMPRYGIGRRLAVGVVHDGVPQFRHLVAARHQVDARSSTRTRSREPPTRRRRRHDPLLKNIGGCGCCSPSGGPSISQGQDLRRDALRRRRRRSPAIQVAHRS